MYTYTENEEYYNEDYDDDEEEYSPEFIKYLLNQSEKLRRGELKTYSLEEIGCMLNIEN